eukprot:NODE_7312_length_597_cov_0.734043_g7289_i0.p2 GENE.NODE_7312_length_597_cov_0.734043_g7289_i0~~NODE_7312_length_597_cov_0.734043_g7289_i0.p2  ORF type:complete len:106 (-),score=1.11 NODE_7312_length_597_cov_0.734043_g7289_i0:79-396(-)
MLHRDRVGQQGRQARQSIRGPGPQAQARRCRDDLFRHCPAATKAASTPRRGEEKTGNPRSANSGSAQAMDAWARTTQPALGVSAAVRRICTAMDRAKPSLSPFSK